VVLSSLFLKEIEELTLRLMLVLMPKLTSGLLMFTHNNGNESAVGNRDGVRHRNPKMTQDEV